MRMRVGMRIGLVGLAFAGASAQAQPTAVSAGRQAFETRCGRCHGGDATGGESGPNIVAKVAARNDADLTAFLREGRPASGMPAFPVSTISNTEMASLVGHLRGIATAVSADAVIPRNQVQGPERRTVKTATGTVEGLVMNEGSTDLQLRSSDGKLHLLRKLAGGQFREVTSQTDWPTYNGGNNGNRYSQITQINKTNVAGLAPKWMFPIPNVTQIETTPLVVQGVMYLSSANECWALDAGTGRQIWHYQRPRTKGVAGNAAIGFNRGVAWAGDRIFMVTDHAHVIALSRSNGELLWETEMADWHENYNGTAAPLTVGSGPNALVIAGTAGGDEGVRGFVAAYNQQTGKEVWRFWTVPKPGKPGAEAVANTWQGANGEHRSGATWMTGTYDADLGLVYWPTGNPGPDFDGADRAGDNLYTDCVVALDVKTGTLKWYFQFTPHDVHDWDAQEPPVLIDANWRESNGQQRPRKLLIQANRNGFFYVLDRTNGQFLLGKQFMKKLNWADGIDAKGRPVLKQLPVTAEGDTYVCPGFQGGTNWFSTSFNPTTNLYYFVALERCNVFSIRTGEWKAGSSYMGGAARPAPGETFEKYLRAINIQTGQTVWEIPQVSRDTTSSAGLLSTASGLVFFGDNTGAFMAADAANGKVLWQFPTNQVWKASPMTYTFDGKQYVAIAVGQNMMAFALGDTN
ncbi:MAG: PQQ-binding-like beta-propeller repeat protein [Acidobacteriota bacterium]